MVMGVVEEVVGEVVGREGGLEWWREEERKREKNKMRGFEAPNWPEKGLVCKTQSGVW